MDKHFTVPAGIREACEVVLKCKSKRARVIGEKKFWEDYYPKASVDQFINSISPYRDDCNEPTKKIMDDIIHRKTLWADKEASPVRWKIFESLVKQLMTTHSYL